MVLDTNVYVSAVYKPGSLLSRLVSAGLNRNYSLIVSPALIAELARILRKEWQWSEEAVLGFIKEIVHASEVIVPTEIPDAVPDDPDDNQIVACAVSGRADLIVTGDRDLLRLVAYQNIGIVRPVDFARTLGIA
ncbi:MAG: putative toxin-antitoxin system toxin component, PIN family [Chromatiales bacterium]|nr:putative toxin-antitoxin system toxin component, PIN family [Chromatiales bacterium]